MTRHSYGTKKVEPGQMYQMFGNGDIYVVIEPKDGQPDGWIIFNISRSRYEWDMQMPLITQYRRLA